MHLQKIKAKQIRIETFFVGILEVTDENNRIRSQIRIRKSSVRIQGSGSVPVPVWYCISRIRNTASLVDIFLNAFNDLFFLCALMGPRHKLLVFTYMMRIMPIYLYLEPLPVVIYVTSVSGFFRCSSQLKVRTTSKWCLNGTVIVS